LKKTSTQLKREKVKRLQNQRKYDDYFEIEWFWEVYFKESGQSVKTFVKQKWWKEKMIHTFGFRSENTSVKSVIWSPHQVFIEYGEKKYLYSLDSADFKEISLKLDISYLKKWAERTLHFVTEKGTFLYKNDEFSYFDVFDDFVQVDQKIIWVIHWNDTRRKKNYWYENESWELIVLYEYWTQKRRILYTTPFVIEKILYENSKVIVIDREWGEFILENY
jgi:hypothetical protein